METNRTLRAHELATLWRTNPSQINEWRKLGAVTIGSQDEPGGPYTFTHAEIDALHRERAAVPGQALPTVAELLALSEQMGTPGLLTTSDAAARLDRTTSAINFYIVDGQLPAFRVGWRWLVPLLGVALLAAKMSPQGVLAIGIVAKILGHNPEVARLLSVGDDAPLTRAQIINENHEVYVTEPSFMAYLTEHLLNCTPTEWREMRALYNYEPLLTIKATKKQYRIHERTITAEINEGRWPVLLTQGKHRRIPQHVIEEWDRARRAMPPSEIAQILGASEAEVASWTPLPSFCPRRHGRLTRREVCPSRACMRQYIATHQVGAPIESDDWLARCLQDHMPLVRASALPGLGTHLDAHTLQMAFENRVIRGVRLPDGNIVLERAEATAFNRRIERQMSGGDYHRRLEDI